MKHTEFELQKLVCQYLELQYPDVLFLSDTIANLKLTFAQQARNKSIQKNGFHCPDLLILEPKGGFNGLFIELKIESPWKKNGELLKNKHIEAQEKSMLKLYSKGYLCTFAWEFEEIKWLIDSYMKSE
jgi:hypothetical protein